MSNFFERVVDDAEKLEEELLGPDYKYYQQIKTPEELGMSDKGSISALAKDINGIINYVELLVTGRGDANKSRNGRPLGDRFFLKTGGQCKDAKTGKLVDRYMYINNVPDGSIPFVSSGIGYKFTTFEGLIPGILSDIDQINPMDMFKAFMQDSEPECSEITLETIDKEGRVGKETRYLPTDEIRTIDKNLKKSREGFTNSKQVMNNNNMTRIIYLLKNIVSSENIYLASIGILYLYIIYRFILKTTM